VTNPADALVRQYVVGDSFEYSCNGDLVPNNPVINMCTDAGGAMATWSVAATEDLPDCSKYRFYKLLQEFNIINNRFLVVCCNNI